MLSNDTLLKVNKGETWKDLGREKELSIDEASRHGILYNSSPSLNQQFISFHKISTTLSLFNNALFEEAFQEVRFHTLNSQYPYTI